MLRKLQTLITLPVLHQVDDEHPLVIVLALAHFRFAGARPGDGAYLAVFDSLDAVASGFI